ncbi:microtubule-destabilizing protein 60-like [Apium graveolens]|uniref:microtubule-destabilizing protein 60-like n=1 Tax=Apium graveolens TaxID=4045 RepID=UPI003D7BC863
MEHSGKISGQVTPVKTPKPNKSKSPKVSENSDPNFSSPNSKLHKSAKKPQKSAVKNPNPNPNSLALPTKIRDRKFVIAKKNLKKEKLKASEVECKCKIRCNLEKCPTVAYEILRVSQEGFFKIRDNVDDCSDKEGVKGLEIGDDCLGKDQVGEDVEGEVMISTNVKRMRDKFEGVQKSVNNVAEPGSGKVKVTNLVKAFEQLLKVPKMKDLDEKNENELEEGDEKGMGLPEKDLGVQVSSYSFCQSDFPLTSESLGLDPWVRSSLDSCQGSFTLSSRNSGGRRSRRNSSESSGTLGRRNWNKRHHRVTSQRPFNLRTEQRGRSKEEEFIKKVQERMMEEEKQRIPVAQGLPWTTDEPECLVKPPVKESTRPVDLVLHSDVRAVERADFDHQVAEKMSYIEQFKMERERQQKLAEEEEIKRLRRNELIPVAQPMPYFDRPFVPRRSLKDPTIPKEPKFHHLPQHKKIKHYKSRSAAE